MWQRGHSSVLFAFTFTAVLVAAPGWAQQTGGVNGRLTDATGALLPGVTVTISGGSLLAPRSQSTGARGGYSLQEIPVGTYTVTFALDGFKTLAHREVIVEAARNVTLNGVLEVASISETLTVSASGQAPMMDPKRQEVGVNVDRRFLEDVPNGRDVWVVLEETPGLVLERFNVGGSESGRQSAFSANGTAFTQNQYSLNGAPTTDPAALGASSSYYAYDAFEEIQVSTAAHPAEVQAPGVLVNMVLKTGSNTFRGSGAFYFENDSLQGNNLDNHLRASGVRQANRIDRYLDYSLDFAGPLIRDRAWFYGHIAEQNLEPFVVGFFLPGFEPGVDSTEIGAQVIRGTFQVKPRHRLEGLYFRNTKLQPHRDAGWTRPSPATALYQDSTVHIVQGSYTGVLTSRLLLDARFSSLDLDFPLGERPDLPVDAFSRIDLATGIREGGPGQNRIDRRKRRQGYSALSYFRDDWLGGSHDFKFGGEFSWNPVETTDRLKGSILYRDFFGRPVQVEIYSDPVTTREWARSLAFFAQDRFVWKRFAFDLGLRLDRSTTGYGDQVKGRGPWDAFFIAEGMPTSTPARSGITQWLSLAPRLGLSYTLTADGRTLVRASFSRYGHQVGPSSASYSNPNGRSVALFSFGDRNGNRLLDPGEIDWNAPVAVNLAASNDIDSEIQPPVTDEVTLGLERELAPDLTLGARFIYRWDQRLIDDVNVGVPFDQYQSVSALDPGLDLVAGTEDDRLIEVFNQNRESLGEDRFVLTNPDGLDGDYLGVQLEARKRFSTRWQMLGSLTVAKATGFLPAPGLEMNEGAGYATPLYGSPNTLINARGRTYWDRTVVLRVSGSYSGFYGLNLGGSIRAQTGQPLYRSIQVSGTVEDIPLNQGPIEVLADPQGFQRHPPVLLADFRIEKEFGLGRFGRLGVIGDGFNLLNANTVTELAQRGRLFGAIMKILPPRIFRIGVRYRF